MQEQINEKTVALSIKTAKLTAEVLQKAIRKMLAARKNKAPKIGKPRNHSLSIYYPKSRK